MSDVSLNSTLGAFVIGAALANIFDINDVANDEHVGIIWVLDTIDIAVTTHVWYFYSIKNFGDVQAFTQGTIVWSLSESLSKECMRYAYGNLDNTFINGYCGWLFSSLQATPVVGYLSVPSFSQTPSIRNALISLFATSISAEFILSVAMIYTLNKGRTASVFPNTIATLVTLMQMVLISGLATSLYSMFILVTFVVWPDTLIFLGVDFFINSLLAMLNARKMIRNVDQSFRLQTIDSSGLAQEGLQDHCRKDKQAIVVSMDIESETV
ncbi:uncharacterized protein BT62DRAFT_1011846 [Guyanagaster necrorhizus]|uniref:DUF6534 domain-containing protein n=1 Tax=Guyanagaster necrorhizus TaxID=856835 RepID=A0A9P7VIJ0_9AGAR|nr:uncharacterized protein BT62DRAFT_1011846 [Guyanagaster necrorhizus MCA 3950]KAG7441257.1 hypothetical protein BT62DRAFT_1011846 [Guyanagaster necrorhizus MCA 3950]